MRKTGKIKTKNIAVVITFVALGVLIRQAFIAGDGNKVNEPKPEIVILGVEKGVDYYQRELDYLMKTNSYLLFYDGWYRNHELDLKKFKNWVEKEIPPEYVVTLIPTDAGRYLNGKEYSKYSAKVTRAK